MKVSKEELLHIANLSNLKINDEEIDKYLNNLQDILSYAEIINSIDIKDIKETIGEEDRANVFRKDEVEEFDNMPGIIEIAPDKERNMFKIPKVIN